MKSTITTIVLILVTTLIFNSLKAVETEAPDTKISVSEQDKIILQQKIDKFLPFKSLPIGELILKIGKDFMGTPYVAKTLDQNTTEPLVVNLRELDCTTFVENCLAIARTIKREKPGFKQFCAELENIRYRNGKRDGYISRLHYFSEWISNNESKRLIDDVGFQLGGVRYQKTLNLMSTKPQSYPQLVGNQQLIDKIALYEGEISARFFFHVPKEKFADCENDLVNGDIFAITTTIKGIDVLHVGFLFHDKNLVYMLHASSSAKKVVIGDAPFIQYLKDGNTRAGAMIARPLELK